MNSIAERIAQKREALGLNQSELARRLGVTPQAVQKWESGMAIPRGGRLEDIATALSTSVAYLLGAESGMAGRMPAPADRTNAHIIGMVDAWDDATQLDEDEVYVPFLKEVELSAGNGRTTVECSGNRKLRFGKLTLRRQGVSPNDAVCVMVSGNSMEPVLPDGSTVGVNRAVTKVTDGKMYAIDHDGQLRVKVLYRLPGGGLRLRSYNRDEYQDEEYSADDVKNHRITILGKVFWSSALW